LTLRFEETICVYSLRIFPGKINRFLLAFLRIGRKWAAMGLAWTGALRVGWESIAMANATHRTGKGGAGGSLLAALLAWAVAAPAHESLYHYVEVRLPRAAPSDPGDGASDAAVELSFSIHAAELPGAREAGADPDSVDLAWLGEMDEAAFELLLEEAREFVAKRFRLCRGTPLPAPGGHSGGIGKEAGAAEAGLVRIEGRLVFPSHASLRADPESAEGARPGFLVGTVELESEALAGLSLEYSSDAEKRLLLVVNRPGSFPSVRDLAPGDSARVAPKDAAAVRSASAGVPSPGE